MEPVETDECDVSYKLGQDEDSTLPCRRVVVSWFIPHPIKGIQPVDAATVEKNKGMFPVMDETGRMDQVQARAITQIESWWELDTDELAAVMNTHLIKLTIYHEPIPPVSLEAVLPGEREDTDEASMAPIAYAHLERAMESFAEAGGLVVEGIMKRFNPHLLKTAGGDDGTEA